MQNKLIVSRRVSTQNSNNAPWTMQNGRSAGAARFQQIPAGFLVVGYTCFRFNCHESEVSPSLSLSVSLLFLPPYTLPLFSPRSPNFIAGHPPMYNSWVTCLFLHTTYQQPCCAAPRGSQLCQAVICLHTEQPAHTSPHQLHSIPGMVLSLTRGSLWSSCPSKRRRQKEQKHGVHVYVWRGGNWLSAHNVLGPIKAPLWIWQLVYSMQG